MGTGIVSILLHNLPYNAPWLQYISYIFFGLNVVLFSVFLILSVLRYTLYPEIWVAMIVHPAQSLFLGCFPMGFASTFPSPLSHINQQNSSLPTSI
jgi:tellurite resistance protein TehA-like permease